MARSRLAAWGVFDHMRAALVLALVFLLASPLVLAQPVQTYWWMPAQGEPSPEFGPDVPATATPVATVTAFSDEQWRGAGDTRYHSIDVPAGSWNRVIMTYTQNPERDPWDRLFQAFFGPVEVLRGAAPRSDMTITRDVTRYASLLPRGGTATIGASTSEYDEAQYSPGAQHVWLNLTFYDDPTASLSEGAASSVVPVFANGWFCGGPGGVANTITVENVTFGGSSGGATLEFFASNHGREEGYMMSRHFDVFVDGRPLTTVYTFPYRYAWVGQYGGDTTVHPLVWWSGFRALDVVGVHTGVGEIPPYRLQLDAAQLALIGTGTHTVSVRGGGIYNCEWITSLSFLLHDNV